MSAFRPTPVKSGSLSKVPSEKVQKDPGDVVDAPTCSVASHMCRSSVRSKHLDGAGFDLAGVSMPANIWLAVGAMQSKLQMSRTSVPLLLQVVTLPPHTEP